LSKSSYTEQQHANGNALPHGKLLGADS